MRAIVIFSDQTGIEEHYARVIADYLCKHFTNVFVHSIEEINTLRTELRSQDLVIVLFSSLHFGKTQFTYGNDYPWIQQLLQFSRRKTLHVIDIGDVNLCNAFYSSKFFLEYTQTWGVKFPVLEYDLYKCDESELFEWVKQCS